MLLCHHQIIKTIKISNLFCRFNWGSTMSGLYKLENKCAYPKYYNSKFKCNFEICSTLFYYFNKNSDILIKALLCVKCGTTDHSPCRVNKAS